MRPIGTEKIVYSAVIAGWLEIREDGSVWRVARRHKSRWDGMITVHPVIPRRIDAVVGAGYRAVKIMIDRKQTTTQAHRLVYHHFYGEIPPSLTINHKNGNKADNHPTNLELATYAEQVRHAREVLRVGPLDQKGEANNRAKLREAAVREIRKRRSAGESLKSIAVDFGVSYQTVSQISLRKRWGFLA